MPTKPIIEDTPEGELVTRREADIRWDAHHQLHTDLQNKIDAAKNTSDTALKVALVDHHREHEVHEKSHDREHQFTKDALDKADSSLEKRLEGMNEFRRQLDMQAATYVTREIFDSYTKEQTIKTEVALVASTDKYDTIIKAIVNRHESDTDSAHSEILAVKESLQREIQGEREYRKAFEGSINTWKWIASFLGLSGVAGVLYMFLTFHQ